MAPWLRQPCQKALLAAGGNCLIHQPVLAPAYRPSTARLREHYHRSLTGKPFVRTGVQGNAGRDTLLNGVPIEYKEDVARVIEQAERAAEKSWTTIHTGESLYMVSAMQNTLQHLVFEVTG